jgi:hypothetical protein
MHLFSAVATAPPTMATGNDRLIVSAALIFFSMKTTMQLRLHPLVKDAGA